MSRREFGVSTVSLLAASQTTTGCNGVDIPPNNRRGHIDARPSATRTTVKPGVHSIGLRQHRDGVLQLPTGAGDGPLPLLVLFHCAGGSAAGLLRHLSIEAASSRAVILAPDADGRTWDALTPGSQTVLDLLDTITGRRRLRGFGTDVAFADQALARVFRDVNIEPGKIAVGGFSDGASYALSLGLINGELFRRIVAFSPGFIRDGDRRGRPEIFISHGRRDEILPIDRSTGRIAQQLRQQGYSATIREFDGGHEVPESIAREALEWVVA
jgi:predicted esterase